MTRAQLNARKATMPCHQCGRFGHWQNEHISGRTLPDNTTSSNTSAYPTNVSTPDHNPDRIKNSNNSKIPAALKYNKGFNDTVSHESDLGLMVDNGAPFSVIRYKQLYELALNIKPNWIGELDDALDEFLDCPYWQYGAGNHASESSSNIESIYITAKNK